MPVNLLTKRLKDAKRELTNLKTAHMRGLGLLRVYTQTTQIDPTGHTGRHEIELTVTLDSAFPEYPFVQLTNKIEPTTHEMIMGVRGYNYIDGHHVKYGLSWWDAFGPASTSYVQVISTAPITNISYDWIS